MQSDNPRTLRYLSALRESVHEDPPRRGAQPILRWEVRAVSRVCIAPGIVPRSTLGTIAGIERRKQPRQASLVFLHPCSCSRHAH